VYFELLEAGPDTHVRRGERFHCNIEEKKEEEKTLLKGHHRRACSLRVFLLFALWETRINTEMKQRENRSCIAHDQNRALKGEKKKSLARGRSIRW
jgi:hypothetical protein